MKIKFSWKLALSGLLLLFAFALLFVPQLVTETTAVTSFAANALFKGNLHAVVPERFYRSSELSADDLVRVIEERRIKTIIDLRFGENELLADGRHEKDIAAEHGAVYYHVPLLGSRADQKEQISKLLEVYDQAPPPMLVHCSSGTHRSGVASAIWLLAKEQAPVETAAEQLSAKYGYFDFERRLKSLVQGHRTIDQIIWLYLKANAERPISFRDWLQQTSDKNLR